MPVIEAQDLRDLGFIPEMFQGQNAGTFDAWLMGIIAEQDAILSGRIGAAVYASAVEPVPTYVKRAEKCLCSAELYQRRLNRLAGNTDEGIAALVSALKKSLQGYLDEAESLIAKLANGTTSDGADFAGGYLESSHFDDASGDLNA